VGLVVGFSPLLPLLWLDIQTVRADPGENCHGAARALQREVASGSLDCWAAGLLLLTSFLRVNALITRVRAFYSAVHKCTDGKMNAVLRGHANLHRSEFFNRSCLSILRCWQAFQRFPGREEPSCGEYQQRSFWGTAVYGCPPVNIRGSLPVSLAPAGSGHRWQFAWARGDRGEQGACVFPKKLQSNDSV